MTSNGPATYTYAAGNLLNDGNHTYTYDAENRIIKVDNGATATYIYDANGQRIRKTSAAGTVDYLYDLAGHEVAEVSSSGTWNRGEVFAGGRHLATYAGGTSGTTYFIHADWLGTERARSNTSGAVCETIQSLPFGDGQATSGTCGDPSPNHFTDKQRDTESNLDDFGARFYSSALGRFASADPLYIEYHRLSDPQGLNIYSYVRNNPLKFTDPLGLDVACDGSRCQDFLNALQKNMKSKLSLKDGKVVADAKVGEKLSKSEKEMLKAINDQDHHVTVHAIDGAKDSSVFFGRSDAPHAGEHTIAFGQASLLDKPGNAGGYSSADLVGHETLEGYSESMGNSYLDAHKYANQYFGGLEGIVEGATYQQQGDYVLGLKGYLSVSGTNIVERITTQFVTKVPVADYLQGKGVPYSSYPTNVEKKP